MAGLKSHESGDIDHAEALSELGLSGQVHNDGIRRAFRQRLKQAHPDLNGGSDSRLRRLILARDLLMSERKLTPEATDSLTIFHSANATGNGVVPLTITLEQALNGGQTAIEVPALEFSSPHEDLTSLTQTKTLQVTLPRGLRAGETVRLKCRGAVREQVFFRIDIEPAAECRVWGDDIWMTAQLDRRLLMHGGKTIIDTPHGPQEIRVGKDVPAGASLCLKGKGLPATELASAGNLYIRLEAAAEMARPATYILSEFRQRWAS